METVETVPRDFGHALPTGLKPGVNEKELSQQRPFEFICVICGHDVNLR